MDLGIRGRVALVTGGSKGIGFAIAAGLAREGVRVAVCARDEAALAAAAERLAVGGSVVAVAGDVSTAEGCRRVFDETCRHFGSADILVNNAGGSSGPAGFLALSDANWLDTFEATLMSAVRLARLAIPPMQQRHWGRIIMISSTSGHQPDVVVPHYNAAKAGLINLAKTLSLDLAADNILVNCVCPGLVRTAAVEAAAEIRLREQGTDVAAMTADEMVDAYFGPRRPIPLGRVGAPDDVAGMVCLLCSEQAAWITGACVDVDGGWTKGMR